jgi:hypothetical protein
MASCPMFLRNAAAAPPFQPQHSPFPSTWSESGNDVTRNKFPSRGPRTSRPSGDGNPESVSLKSYPASGASQSRCKRCGWCAVERTRSSDEGCGVGGSSGYGWRHWGTTIDHMTSIVKPPCRWRGPQSSVSAAETYTLHTRPQPFEMAVEMIGQVGEPRRLFLHVRGVPDSIRIDVCRQSPLPQT